MKIEGVRPNPPYPTVKLETLTPGDLFTFPNYRTMPVQSMHVYLKLEGKSGSFARLESGANWADDASYVGSTLVCPLNGTLNVEW